MNFTHCDLRSAIVSPEVTDKGLVHVEVTKCIGAGVGGGTVVEGESGMEVGYDDDGANYW